MKKIFSLWIFVFFSFFVFSQQINLSNENLPNTDLTETNSSEEKILSLSEIDVLIKDTDYDKALVELQKVFMSSGGGGGGSSGGGGGFNGLAQGCGPMGSFGGRSPDRGKPKNK